MDAFFWNFRNGFGDDGAQEEALFFLMSSFFFPIIPNLFFLDTLGGDV